MPRGPAWGAEEASAEAAAGGGWPELPLLKKLPSREGAAGWYRCGSGGAVRSEPIREHVAAGGGGVKSRGSASAESGLREEDGALSQR